MNRPGAVEVMKLFVVVMQRTVIILIVVAALAIGGILGLSKMGVDTLPPQQMREFNKYVDIADTKAVQVKKFIAAKLESYFHKHEKSLHEEHKIVVTSPKAQDVVITDSFVCQIRSQRHIEVRALEGGYLAKIWIQEGRTVKTGEVMFKVLPILYEAKANAEQAEAEFAQVEYDNANRLFLDQVVSINEVKLLKAKLTKAQAKATLARAELNFTDVKAPFDGIVDRLLQREGSLIKEGDILTTLADNSVMWVYFNVPEKYYLQYMAHRKQHEKEDKIELVLANGDTFPQAGRIGAIEADFNNENGNIKFRADYPNPELLLRHGQTGKILIHRPLRNALLIPQRATFDILDKRYVWIVDEKDVAHQTLITTSHELEDIFVVSSGLNVKDKIVLEGIREVEEGVKVKYEFHSPEETLKNQKNRAE